MAFINVSSVVNIEGDGGEDGGEDARGTGWFRREIEDADFLTEVLLVFR